MQDHREKANQQNRGDGALGGGIAGLIPQTTVQADHAAADGEADACKDENVGCIRHVIGSKAHLDNGIE